ncbi:MULTISPECIES: MFS transporter [Sphingobium]|jgi:DHA1 family inner membrane transport protein|uniref:MFS permease n=1 Tax=Sphingobium fuliginis (strain ATCC 27551) TaxID=336203 RepID=A0A292ZF94_SPHSA|nr:MULTISPECIES: MFS transporter [Sphingobium]AJR25221.1 MFS transporter [Sphingobium sp. YBL2]QOT72548.1 MFS transporter [Sphingobium fuliginis]RYL98710.1 MFS transporter [Sphingobium fuliginis]WDA37516.1 MFS transporter [Sphingobium sp. YC-XJ3]GAY21495.1 MFS permease [Sphingobium fuliginis]
MAQASRAVHPALVILALSMGAFAIGTTEFAAMSLLPFFAGDLRISEPMAGHAISAYALGVVVGAPLIAVLGARLPRRKLLIGLMAWFAIGNALSALSPDYTTMLLFRFLSGLPHGAYFGVAALVAASLVPNDRRALAVAQVMTGLTVATVVGVPVANWTGQALGWRWGFGIVALLAVITVTLVAIYAPRDAGDPEASPMRELGALREPQVLLTLLTGAIGFGGLFAVYTYVASTMISVTHVSEELVPVVLAIFGIGLTIGNLVAASAADRAPNRTAIGVLLWSAASLALFPLMAGNIWSLSLVIFLIGCGGGLGSVLQTRLMDVAGDAQTLAAAAHNGAFNVANALGPWLGGLAISAGYGLTSTGWIGAGLALGGLAVFLLALNLRQRSLRLAAVACE